MQSFEDEFARVMRDLFPPDKPIGGEEICSHGGVLMLTAIFDREGFADRLAAFFARPDVKGDDPYDRSSPAFASFRFIDPLPDPGAKAALASSLGTPDMPPFHAQALMKAFEDAGLGDLSTAARMAVLRPFHPAGAALAQAIAAEPGAISPGRLRELAAPILRTHTAAGGIALPPADAERMEAALAKYDGGLPAEQFNAIGELDFAGCDNAPADAEIERNPPVANKIAAGVNLLPEPFRFNLDPTTSFNVVLN